MKHLLAMDDPVERRGALADAFKPGAEVATATQDFLSTCAPLRAPRTGRRSQFGHRPAWTFSGGQGDPTRVPGLSWSSVASSEAGPVTGPLRKAVQSGMPAVAPSRRGTGRAPAPRCNARSCMSAPARRAGSPRRCWRRWRRCWARTAAAAAPGRCSARPARWWTRRSSRAWASCATASAATLCDERARARAAGAAGRRASGLRTEAEEARCAAAWFGWARCCWHTLCCPDLVPQCQRMCEHSRLSQCMRVCGATASAAAFFDACLCGLVRWRSCALRQALACVWLASRSVQW